MRHYDHIVVGTGSMGAAACYHLAARGLKVLGIDRHTVPHQLGSHSGQLRIIRKAYFEHPDYIPLLQGAYRNWEHLENITGTKLFHKTGLLYAAPGGHELTEAVKKSAALYGIPLQEPEKSVRSLFRSADDYEYLMEPEAGFLLADAAIEAYLLGAKNEGAEIHQQERILSWHAENGRCIVNTDAGNYSCKKIIFTAGPWTGQLIPEIKKHLRIHRQVQLWIRPPEPEKFSEKNFPCWLYAHKDLPGPCYGFPYLNGSVPAEPKGLKLALHYPGEATDPDRLNRAVSPDETNFLLDHVKKILPLAGTELTAASTCLYEMTGDEHFVIDNIPSMEETACMAWGFSGHGFKFASVIGEILADLAMYGNTAWPIGFLKYRF